MRMKITTHILTVALLGGVGASLICEPALIRKLWQTDYAKHVLPEGAANGESFIATLTENSACSEKQMFHHNPWLMIAGVGPAGDVFENSNSAVTAGLPDPKWFQYQAEVSRLVAATSRSASDPISTQGAGNRFTQSEIDMLTTGVNQVFTDLENSLVDQVFGEQLPLVGDGFQVAHMNNVASFRHLGTMRAAITGALNTFTGSSDYDPAAVATAIRNQLVSFHASTSVTSGTPGEGARIDFVTRRDYGAANVPVAADFGFPNLDFERLVAANVSTSASAQFNFAIGVDAEGFYLETAGSTFTFNTITGGAGINTTARLAKLNHTVTDNAVLPTAHTANFNILLKEPGGDGKLRVSELLPQPDLLDATLTGNTRTALKLDSTTPTNVMFPRVGTDLTIDWNFTAAVVNPDDDNSAFGSQPVLTLDNNRVTLETFLRGFANNVLDRIGEITDPLDPVIDVLGAPIPLLSDLGSDKLTLLDIFDLPQETQDAVNSLQRISDLANLAQTVAFSGSPTVDLGSWTMAAHDPRVDLLDELTGAASRAPSPTRPAALNTFLNSASQIDGLEFPLLTDGAAVVEVLMGRNASLFTYRSGKITIVEDFHESFPVLGPVGITFGGLIGFEAEFGFGYDSQGLFDYHAGGGTDSSLLANGFYAMSLDEEGNPLTGISLTAGVSAGVEINFFVASAGVEGRIGATIGLYLDDQLGDEGGRIRADDFASNPIDDWFYASGRLWAGVSAYLRVGWPPVFGFEYEFDSPEVTLLSFDTRPTETPVLAEWHPFIGGRLDLNVGDRSPEREYGDLDDRAESFRISIVPAIDPMPAKLLVEGFGVENEFTSFPSRIVGHANLRGDSLVLESDVGIVAELTGGPGPDILRGGSLGDILDGADGNDRLGGRSGDDQMFGGADNDFLIGGDGADLFDGGLGDDTASWSGASFPLLLDLRTSLFGGCAFDDTLVGIERYQGSDLNDQMDGSESADALLHGANGDDVIRGHGGADLLDGGFGADDIDGGEGDDFVLGGPDADQLNGGPGTDTLSYLITNPLPNGGPESPIAVSLLNGLGTAGHANGDVISNFEVLIGSELPSGLGANGDVLEGSHQPETIYGMDGSDEIRGQGGNDILYGNHPESPLGRLPGSDRDTLSGGEGGDQLFGHGDYDLLNGENGADTLWGGEGDDHLIDNDTAFPDALDGEAGYDRLTANYSNLTGAVQFFVGQQNGMVLSSGDSFQGVETIGTFRTGSGDDVIKLAASKEPSYFNKFVDAGPGNDYVAADFRGTYAYLSNFVRTSDSLHGGEGNDTISFEHSIEGVTVNFGAAPIGLGIPALGGAAVGLTLSGFENLVGTPFADTLAGDNADNVIAPLAAVYPGSNDQIYGGGGIDTLVVDYSQDAEAALIGLRMTPNSGPYAWISLNVPVEYPPGRHYYTSIEQFDLTGSQGADYLYGELISSGNDRFLGMGGNDVIYGRAGDDYLEGGEGGDYLDGEYGNETIYGGPGNDWLFMNGRASEAAGYGRDLADGGEGNDWISIHHNPGTGGNYARPDNSMKVDGGPGFDALTIDLAYLTTSFTWDDAAPTDHVLRNGGYIRNIERIRDLCTGSGVDTILLRGRHDNLISTGDGNDVLNTGLGKDIVRMGHYLDDNLLIVDYSEGDTPDLGGALQVNGSSPIERRRLADNVIIDSITFVGGPSRMHFTGTSKRDVIWGFNEGNDILLGAGGNDQLDGNAGNDWLDGGPGADTMNDSGGNDTYIVDDVGDIVTAQGGEYWWVNGSDTVRSSVNFTLPFGIESLQLTGSAISGTGTSLANNITGNTRNNILNGGLDNDSLNGGGGAREIDTLIGGDGADTFFLGLLGSRFYDDGNSANPGHDGYALITDFTPSQNDRLRLAGTTGQYLLGVSPFNPDDDAIYHDSNGNAALDPSDELIAILQSTQTLTNANTITNATYQNAVDPAVVGLTAAPVAAMANGTSGPVLSAAFSILETPPPNVRIDVIASNDLGNDDPWTLIATKTGTGAWSGPASVTASPAVNGRVSVTVSDMPQTPRPQQRFFRIRLVPL
jgi:Ca2+-binding RTX toxin-like protein